MGKIQRAPLTDEQKKLVEKNTPLVKYLVVKKLLSLVKRTGTDMDDAIQAGYLGLCKAAADFDPSRGILFGTFAGRCIFNEILNECYLTQQTANHSSQGVPRLNIGSLDAPIPGTGDDSGKVMTLHDTAADRRAVNPEGMAVIRDRIDHLETFLAHGTGRFKDPKERKQLMRLILSGVPKTVAAHKLGITQSGYSRLYIRAVEASRR
jgi:RNA polymerase sigma factor (sigma-70 family)